MPLSAYSPIRDNNAVIAPGNITTQDPAQQQIVNAIRQLMADLAGFQATGSIGNLTVTGLLDLIGGQIKFPATQVPSANPNTLDDYEEGTYVPEVAGTTLAGVGTYSLQSGFYTKIGRLVMLSANIAWSAHTGTGNLLASAFPFAIGDWCVMPIIGNTLAYTAGNTLCARSAGSTNMAIIQQAAAAAIGVVPMDTVAGIQYQALYMV